MSISVLSVVGTRPEAIKMAPIIRELAHHPDSIRSVVCSTGQHRHMLAQALDLFGLVPDFDLAVMQADQSLARLTAHLLTGLDDVVQQVQPDWILAVGDTTTVLASALIAHYHRVRFGHVEAGLRTGHKFMPFPEELNRRIADLAADIYFAPTETARQTLLEEGCPPPAIFLTGNPIVDALLAITAQPFDWAASPLAVVPQDRRLVLVTAHRREHFGPAFREICLALRDLAGRFEPEGVTFVFPVHLNPNVQQPVREMLSDLPNMLLLDPLDYRALANLMRRSTLVLTDSGGIQEEAPTFGVPVLVMREATERPEGITAGGARLTGPNRERIVAEASRLLSDPVAHAAMTRGDNPYGDGHAAERIVKIILEQPA